MPYWQVERQETLCHWQHSCLSSLFFLFIDWEYYLPLHPAVCTSLAAEIHHWLLGNMSIRARGYFCWAAGQRRKLGGGQVMSTLCNFRQMSGSFFLWFDRLQWGISGRCRCTERLSRSISLSGCLSQLVNHSLLGFDVTFFIFLHQSVWSAKNKSVLAETPHAL